MSSASRRASFDPPALPDLIDALRRSWCAETSADPEAWTPENPAWGQCAVTAALLHDVLGGDVVWGEAVLPDGRRISHYWNRIGDAEIDLTRGQFPAGTVFPLAGRRDTKVADAYDYVLSHPRTRERYARLRAALGLPAPEGRD